MVDATDDAGVRYTLDGEVARITIVRPAVKNALDRPAWAALGAAVRAAAASPARVVVLTGEGGAFCAGGDLSSIEARLALPADVRQAQLTEDAQVIAGLLALGRPTVALIDGPAMGAGLALALACDVRLASDRSLFSAAFRKVGLAGDFGISWLLPRAVGRGRALDLFYTGELLDAASAHAAGLVERVYPAARFAADSAAYVALLASGPAALPILRRVVDEVAGLSLDDALPREAAGQAEASRTADAREGARAFLEKRPTRFAGK